MSVYFKREARVRRRKLGCDLATSASTDTCTFREYQECAKNRRRGSGSTGHYARSRATSRHVSARCRGEGDRDTGWRPADGAYSTTHHRAPRSFWRVNICTGAAVWPVSAHGRLVCVISRTVTPLHATWSLVRPNHE